MEMSPMTNDRPLTHQQTELLLAVYRDLSSPEQAAVAEHLAACKRCSAFAEANRQIDTRLKQSIRQQPDPRLSQNFYNIIETDGRSWYQTFFRLSGQLAGIAVLLVVVLSSWLFLRSGPVQTPIEAPTPTVQPTVQPTAQTTLVPTASPDPGTSLQPLYTMSQTVSLFALSPESSYLATADIGVIKIWDTATGKNLHPIAFEEAPIVALAFTPNGVNLLGQDNNGQFHRWLAFNGSYQRPFEGPKSPVGNPFALGNARLVIVTAENNLELWPLVGNRPTVTIETSGEPIASVAVSADGQSIAVVTQDGSVSLWNEYGKTIETLAEVTDGVSGLVFTNDARQFVTYQENTLQLWQGNNSQQSLSSEDGPAYGAIDQVQFASENQFLMVSYTGGFLQFWDVNTGELVKTFHSQAAVQTAIGLTRNSFLYLTLDSQNLLTVWEKPEE
jgi:WD40 repeat protein